MKIYIASPFFDQNSCEWVTSKEIQLTGFKIDHFSPRQDGVNFHSIDNPNLRSECIKAIFNNNIKQLDECDHIFCNLNPCNGRLDIGTLFELGYFVAKNHGVDLNDKWNLISGSDEVLAQVTCIIHNLNNIEANIISSQDKKDNVIIHYTDDKIELVNDLFNLNTNIFYCNSDLSNISKMTGNRYIFLIDDYPIHLFILMGWMYAMNIPYYTCSLKGFGSNVMIAASSEGHIQLPGITDDTFNKNMK